MIHAPRRFGTGPRSGFLNLVAYAAPPSGQRAWWGEDGEESREATKPKKPDPEELLSLCRTAWQIETSNVTLGSLVEAAKEHKTEGMKLWKWRAWLRHTLQISLTCRDILADMHMHSLGENALRKEMMKKNRMERKSELVSNWHAPSTPLCCCCQGTNGVAKIMPLIVPEQR